MDDPMVLEEDGLLWIRLDVFDLLRGRAWTSADLEPLPEEELGVCTHG